MFNQRDPPGDDDLFELLGNSRRRLLLYHLIDRDGEASLRDLSRDIVVHETGAPSGEVNDEKLTSVYVSLYQTHVPALEDCEVIEYDDDAGVVYLGERTGEILSLLRDPRERRREWAIPYLLVGTVLGALVVVSLLDPALVPGPIMSAATLGGTVALVALAAGRYYRDRAGGIDDASLEELAS